MIYYFFLLRFLIYRSYVDITYFFSVADSHAISIWWIIIWHFGWGDLLPQQQYRILCHGKDFRLYRDSIFVNLVYIPMHICSDHWVTCVVHFDLWEIRIYDFAFDVHSDAELNTALQPLCCLLLHLLNQMGFYDNRLDVDHSLDLFMYSRLVESIPRQAPNSGNCGILTCMFIQYLGLRFLSILGLRIDSHWGRG